jgi:hypothetical protein
MKQDIAHYITKCLECQQVKVEHQHPGGLLQPIQIPEWKWEVISMDFIIDLPKTIKVHDAIMVVVDKLSKEAHFIPIKYTFESIDVANIFMKEIFRLHGFPKTIISDRDAKFTSNLWKSLFASLEMQLAFSMTCHPQTNGQNKRVNKVLEDMLRMHVMHRPKQWEEYLPLVELAYKNGYQESLKTSPFEVLYGRKCRVSISLDSLVEKITLGPELLKEMEEAIVKIKQNFKIAQDRHKSYVNSKRTPREFKVGDHLYLQVKTKRISLRMGMCAKLAP